MNKRRQLQNKHQLMIVRHNAMGKTIILKKSLKKRQKVIYNQQQNQLNILYNILQNNEKCNQRCFNWGIMQSQSGSALQQSLKSNDTKYFFWTSKQCKHQYKILRLNQLLTSTCREITAIQTNGKHFPAIKYSIITDKQFISKMNINQNLSNQQWLKIQKERQINIQQMEEIAWKNSQMQEQIFHNQWKNSHYEHQAHQWIKQKKMENEFQKAVSYDQQQKRIKSATSSMIQVMINDPDPKFKNSKFLEFLSRINKGELEIRGKELIEHKQKILQNKMQDVWKKKQQELKTEQQKINLFWEKGKEQVNVFEQQYQKFWENKLEDYQKMAKDSQNFEKILQQKYFEILKEMENTGDQNLLDQAWQKASDLEEQMIYKNIESNYIFSKNNQYLNHQNPMQQALQLIGKGNTNQAILAIQAHVQKNQDSDAWRIMGKLLQQLDQDQKACSCFIQSLKIDPNNSDSLLVMGISCTNVYDDIRAMQYLKRWMLSVNQYRNFMDPHIINPDMLQSQFLNPDDIMMINKKMIVMFQKALNVKPKDPQLLTAFAVLFFIKRQYEQAVKLFQQALLFDQMNYSLWNKLGATLAHLGKADQAIDCYHRALQIRPNYVRVWVNLGIAHAFKNNYSEAARFYLNALNLRPDAKHLWSYLQTVFMCMRKIIQLERYDLIGKISYHDPNIFKDDFELIKHEDLPNPKIEYMQSSHNYLIKQKAIQWVNEYLKNK